MTVSPDQIIVGSGTEYLYHRLIHLLEKDCVVGVDDPGFSHIKRILQIEGVSYRAIPMDEAGMCVDALGESGANAVHVSPMHHFPMGITMPVKRRVELLQWVNGAPGRYIIEDDYNCEYLYEGSPVSSLFDLDVRGRVVYMNTFSKTVMPSLRVAYMVLPEKLMDRYLETMSFYSCTVSGEVQLRLARFISEGHFERFIHRVRKHNVEQRKMLQDAFLDSDIAEKAHILKSYAGTHVLVKLVTPLSDVQIGELLLRNGINASLVSNHCEKKDSALKGLLVLNYSRITQRDIDYLIGVLEQAVSPSS